MGTAIDLIAMKGRSKGKYRIRTGNIRIIFYIERNEIYVITVEEIGFRSDVYKLREADDVYQTDA